MLNKIWKKLIALVMVMVMTLSFTSQVFAYSDTNMSTLNFTKEDREFLSKFQSILDGFVYDDTGKVTLIYPVEYLEDLFSPQELVTLNKINENIQNNSVTNENMQNNSVISEDKLLLNPGYGIRPQFHVEGATIYFDYYDIQGFLFAAASAGPPAMYAALTALGTISLGPVGTTLAVVLGIIGAPGLAGFCYTVIRAYSNGRGVYLGVRMDGWFPVIECDVW